MQFRSNTNRSNFQNGSSLKKKNSKEKRGEKNPTRKNTPDRAEEIISSYHEYTRIIHTIFAFIASVSKSIPPFYLTFPCSISPSFPVRKMYHFSSNLGQTWTRSSDNYFGRKEFSSWNDFDNVVSPFRATIRIWNTLQDFFHDFFQDVIVDDTEMARIRKLRRWGWYVTRIPPIKSLFSIVPHLPSLISFLSSPILSQDISVQNVHQTFACAITYQISRERRFIQLILR